MKKIKLIFSALVLIGGVYAFTQGGSKYNTLEIGENAPMTELEMKAADGKKLSLEKIKGEKGALVIFSCNTCPFVIAWEDRYPQLDMIAKNNNIGMTLINSNEAKRKGDDSIDKMKEHATEMGYPSIPYLVDANSELANAFGAKTTPHVFLFDADWKLVYEGSIDDNHKSAKDVKARYLENAMYKLANGEKIDPNNTKAIGCSIKRVAQH
jgi:peroxiredoxin